MLLTTDQQDATVRRKHTNSTQIIGLRCKLADLRRVESDRFINLRSGRRCSFGSQVSLTFIVPPNHLPLVADLGVNGAALAALELIEDMAALFVRLVGVKEGESTLRLFFGLSHCQHGLYDVDKIGSGFDAYEQRRLVCALHFACVAMQLVWFVVESATLIFVATMSVY